MVIPTAAKIIRGEEDAAVPDDAGAGDQVVAHEARAYYCSSLAGNLETCRELLRGYSRCAGIMTTRLHCYLPCRALGLPVELRQRLEGDRRFAGLTDVDAERWRDLAQRTREVVACVVATGNKPGGEGLGAGREGDFALAAVKLDAALFADRFQSFEKLIPARLGDRIVASIQNGARLVVCEAVPAEAQTRFPDTVFVASEQCIHH